MNTERNCTAFLDRNIAAAGVLRQVVGEVRRSMDEPRLARLLIFDDRTGGPIDVDLRGESDEFPHERMNELSDKPEEPIGASEEEEAQVQPASKVGRPKLGVVSGEVTLLPRHWEWLKSQPGGASVTLRKLVEEARRAGEEEAKKRESQEAAYRFMTAMAGDLDGYEEALRELYAGNRTGFERCIKSWEPDIAGYTLRLAEAALAESDLQGGKPNEANNR